MQERTLQPEWNRWRPNNFVAGLKSWAYSTQRLEVHPRSFTYSNAVSLSTKTSGSTHSHHVSVNASTLLQVFKLAHALRTHGYVRLLIREIIGLHTWVLHLVREHEGICQQLSSIHQSFALESWIRLIRLVSNTTGFSASCLNIKGFNVLTHKFDKDPRNSVFLNRSTRMMPFNSGTT
jgi:hypothetical protein